MSYLNRNNRRLITKVNIDSTNIELLDINMCFTKHDLTNKYRLMRNTKVLAMLALDRSNRQRETLDIIKN